MSNGIQEPQTEIVVSFEGREIACLAFFPDEEGGADVVCGMENPGAIQVVASLLRQASLALNACFGDNDDASESGIAAGVETGDTDRPF